MIFTTRQNFGDGLRFGLPHYYEVIVIGVGKVTWPWAPWCDKHNGKNNVCENFVLKGLPQKQLPTCPQPVLRQNVGDWGIITFHTLRKRWPVGTTCLVSAAALEMWSVLHIDANGLSQGTKQHHQMSVLHCYASGFHIPEVWDLVNRNIKKKVPAYCNPEACPGAYSSQNDLKREFHSFTTFFVRSYLSIFVFWVAICPWKSVL